MSAATLLAEAIAEAIGGNDEQQEVSVWLDTGFAPLNHAISGDYRKGLPCGRIVEMFGPPSCGKTAIATKAMVAAQKAGGIAMFNDHENSFDVGLAIDLGLDPTPGQWVYKTPETFEESIDNTVKLARVIRERKLIPSEAPIVAVFDSLASMVPQSKLRDAKGAERGAESYGMHDNTALARCTSAAFPALAQFAAKLNILVLFLNQQREKPGVAYGDPTTTPGGKAPEYYASVRIALTREIIRDKNTKEVLGQQINANCKKNKVSRPFQTAEWRFMFREDGTGYFDAYHSILEYMKAQGKLDVSGNFINWSDGKKYLLAALAKKLEADDAMESLLAVLEGK